MSSNLRIESFLSVILICIMSIQANAVSNHNKSVDLKDINIPHLEINFTSLNIPGYSGAIILNNIIISGFDTVKFSNVEIKPIIIGGLGISIKAKINCAYFNITTDYEMDSTIDNFYLFGSGELFTGTKQWSFDVDIALHFIPFAISKFKLVPSTENIKLTITGFYNDKEQSSLLEQMVDDVATAWINEKGPDIADELENIIKGLFNTNIYLENGYYGINQALLKKFVIIN